MYPQPPTLLHLLPLPLISNPSMTPQLTLHSGDTSKGKRAPNKAQRKLRDIDQPMLVKGDSIAHQSPRDGMGFEDAGSSSLRSFKKAGIGPRNLNLHSRRFSNHGVSSLHFSEKVALECPVLSQIYRGWG